jgi:glycogen synthase
VAAKGSSLADTTAALIASLFNRGVDVHVAVPHYRCLFGPPGNGLGSWDRTRISKEWGSRVHLAEDRLFYYRDGVDSYADDGDLRPALVFQREVINHIVPWVQPDLIHCHDWMTSLIPPMARRLGIPCLFTLHNPVSHHATLAEIEETGIDAAEFWQYLYYEGWPGNYETTRTTNPVDFLASAVIAADYVNATSAGFLAELLGGTADDVVSNHLRREIALKADKGNVGAIPTGFGSSLGPSRDRSLVQRYTATRHRVGKHLNKAALRRRLGLRHNGEAPLIFWPSRMDAGHRGSELLTSVIPLALSRYGETGLQIVVAGTKSCHGAWDVSRQGVRSGAAAVMGDFDEDLIRLAYAASDFALIPSLYERCGMAEAIGMLYGALPLVPAAGQEGDMLAPLEASADKGNAFPFRRRCVSDVTEAIGSAMRFYKEPPSLRVAQVERVMKQSARTHRCSEMGKRYVALYENLLGRRVMDGGPRLTIDDGKHLTKEERQYDGAYAGSG